GVRLRRWVSFHGICINVAPDLEHYNGIVPCGIAAHGVTSLTDLGLSVTMAELDEVLERIWQNIFEE
ncbi:MAG: lipoate-protein ligase B, partial [Emcibacter sp.]|nr:lipoate-protein ligase B [Emcibacter sp.]